MSIAYLYLEGFYKLFNENIRQSSEKGILLSTQIIITYSTLDQYNIHFK